MTTKEEPGLDAIGTVPVCQRCGSERVVTDAWACWNREAGFWELEAHFDQAFCHGCEAATQLQWIRVEGPENGRVRDLNDAFRTLGQGRGSVFVTDGVSSQGPEFVTRALAAVRGFDSFSEDNDPWGEHDFGSIELEGHKLFWKIDPYDLDLQAHSQNAANPAVTHRVLTLMLASEY
ncbi:DUF3768 domain-containing protein [Sulfitobacter sp. JBTF-M27]|uniref:DUF3768 domain-containing protein n=1 Tax=Sulfitobacter sediminilitoris TaxID=2698830 RepID=A0A6P0CGH4_9RHOB|nr:DUF3768 domain-containing protein [Sulfitobacter sediminilitoris]NEK25271.1 DUF3768 domain-containing protein [Sulfitobacter sediminilitoris]